MSNNVYELGRGFKKLESGQNYPYTIGIVESAELMFFVHEGSGFTDAGGIVPALSLASREHWNDHFHFTGLEWLRELLKQHELGDLQTFKSLCEHYENKYGYPPKLNPALR
jgi:hypothetical protein